MSDEIKEILDRCYPYLFGDEVDKLGNYITNLQEKYDKALTDLVHESHKRIELENKITNLQQENQELNDSVTWWNNRFNAVQRDYEELQQEK